MNFEEYVNHMTKKYKLAVVLAVLKNKPSELTTDQYIEQLREKLNENIDIDNDDIICSTDFDFEENSLNSDTDVNYNDNLNERLADINNIDNKATQYEETVDQSIIVTINCTENVETASIDLLEDYNVILDDTTNEHNNIEVNEVAHSRNDHRNLESHSLNEVLETLRAIDENVPVNEDPDTTNFTQDIFSEYSQIITPNNNNICEENMAIDNQPFVNFNTFNEDRDDFTIIDQRLKEKIAKNITRNKEICKIQEENLNTIENMQDFEEQIPRNRIDTSVAENQTIVGDFVHSKTDIVSKNIEREMTEIPPENVEDRNLYNSENFVENDTVTNTLISNNLTYDSQQTIPYSLHGFIENTHISQSQCNNIEIPNKFLFGRKPGTNNDNVENMNIVKTAENKEIINKTQKDSSVNKKAGLMMIESNQIEYIIDKNGKTYAVLQSISQNDNPTALSDHNITNSKILVSEIKELDKKDVGNSKTENMKVPTNKIEEKLQKQKDINTENLENRTQKAYTTDILETTGTQKDFNTEILENRTQINTEISENRTHKDYTTDNLETTGTQKDFNTETLEIRTQTAEILENDEDVEMSSQDTTVPFKVVKELSKIKSYLFRERKASTEGYSSDSGYKSDSQSSFRSAHLSESWMHQSAYCLYSYIVQCPLAAFTQEIVAEISQVLGKLIDKLHEEEKYPSFVEELLDKIDHLLKDLYEGDSTSDNVLPEKDEIIQRLLLLNKSTHILKFTIDKISVILDTARTNMTSEESLYELSNISEIENLCYIFNLLEILIKKFIKVKNNNISQNTQTSQETKILKKSTISEIWRKKWNPNLKEMKNVGSQQKVCCLDNCGVVLNKIIVECIGGYSLISFAALQCFNLLQNQ